MELNLVKLSKVFVIWPALEKHRSFSGTDLVKVKFKSKSQIRFKNKTINQDWRERMAEVIQID